MIAFEGDGHANATKKIAEVEAELGELPSSTSSSARRTTATSWTISSCSTVPATNSTVDEVNTGKLTPVFFGSALTNFGVEPFLQDFLRLAPEPQPYTDTLTGEKVDPYA